MPTIPATGVVGSIGTYARAARQACADDHGADFASVEIESGRPGTIHTHDAECSEHCMRHCDNAAFVWDMWYYDPRSGRRWAATYALTLDQESIVCWMD